MTIESGFRSRVNSVVIFDNHDSMVSHIQALKTIEAAKDISVVYLSCKHCKNLQYDSTPACITKSVLELLTRRTRVGCTNPTAWFKHSKANTEFSHMVQALTGDEDAEQLSSFLSRYIIQIHGQIKRLLEIEKRSFAVFVVSDFEQLNQEEQPFIAGMLHRLTKGTPAYFRILSVGRPVLFRKDDRGEVGIQRDHDYVETRDE